MDPIYLAPLVPGLTRLVLILRFLGEMSEVPSEAEQDRDDHRALILAFAGFSFTGVAALVVLGPAATAGLEDAVFFLLVSFLTYLWALNLQGYKAARWQGEIANAITETGSLCLILALVSLLRSSAFGSGLILGGSVLAGCIWLLDHLFKLAIDWKYLTEKERNSRRR